MTSGFNTIALEYFGLLSGCSRMEGLHRGSKCKSSRSVSRKYAALQRIPYYRPKVDITVDSEFMGCNHSNLKLKYVFPDSSQTINCEHVIKFVCSCKLHKFNNFCYIVIY